MALRTRKVETYREVQRITQLWIWLVVLVGDGLAWWAFIQQVAFHKPFGSNPAPDFGVVIILVLVGIGLPLFLFVFRLKVEVNSEAVRLRMFPIWSRTIPLSTIRECRPRTYRPLLEYGGWGLRFALGRGWAYTVSGKRGVQLTLTRGRPVLIGSNQPEQLAAAIDAAMKCP
jgi:hypothetical protein